MLLSKRVVVVSLATIRRAEARIGACENCDGTVDAPFSEALDSLGIAPRGSEFFLCEAAHCPACGQIVIEHTLVEIV